MTRPSRSLDVHDDGAELRGIASPHIKGRQRKSMPQPIRSLPR